MSARRFVGALIAIAILATSVHAAKPSKEKISQAKKFFQAGTQAYENGQFLIAATAFEEAYRITPYAAIAFSTAQAYRRQYFVDSDAGKLKRALNLYRQYLKEDKRGRRRRDAVQNISDIEPLLARLELVQRRKGRGPIGEMRLGGGRRTQLMIASRTPGAQASIDGGPFKPTPVVSEVKPGKHQIRVRAEGFFPEQREDTAVSGRLIVDEVLLSPKPVLLKITTSNGASILIDGRPAGTTPLTAPLSLPAGKRFVTVRKSGHYPFTRELSLSRGQQLSLDANLEQTTQRAASHWVVGSAGVLFLAGVAATTVGLVHRSKAQSILDKRDTVNISTDELVRYNDQIQKSQDLRTMSYGLYAGAAAVGVTGLLLYIIDNPRVEAPPQRTIVPVALPGGAGVTVSGSF